MATEARIEVTEMVEEMRPPCIVRVPEFLKRLNEGSYVPQLLGLGPYHHNQLNNNPNFDLISHKCKARENGLSRHPPYLPPLEDCRSFLRSHEKEIKAYYSHDFKFDAEAFLLDAIFIIELAFAADQAQASDRFHPLLDHNMLKTSLGIVACTDLFKLENQIPFFVLKYLRDVRRLTRAVFISGSFFPIKIDFSTLEKEVLNVRNEVSPPRHLLESVYCCVVKSMCPSSEGRAGESKTKDDWAIPAATELHNVGIIFHESQEQNRLCFKKGRLIFRGHLYLPKLQLDDCSEVMIRNVMAFEEFCVKPGKRFFNNYVSLMKHLIHTEADVALLIKHGVIKNDLENEQSVATLFHNLSMFNTVDNVPEIREHIVNNVRNYYQNSLRVTLHEYIQARFSKPWQIWGSIAALILLVCAVLSTIYSAKSSVVPVQMERNLWHEI